ncbi:MAG: alpha/beta hydrolase [Actinomycetota bacterium]|nr:alpha/beta hydrolase [Actinomycetota bacterium]MDP3631393.1 alpha/beta hydrolase [Actinomycetota bacterium]
MSGTSRKKRILLVVAAVLVALLVVPLIWPVPPLENTVTAASLADGDSRFIDIDGLNVHYKAWGLPSSAATIGVDTAIVLLHGFGASTFSWHEVAEPLSGRIPVVAFDRPAFGLTDRPLTWTGQDPYAPETQADLTVKLMDKLGIRRAVLIGHSAGGTVAALVAERYPERVAAIVLEDPAIFAGGPPAFLTPLFRTPQFRRLGPLFARSLGGNAGTDLIKTAWHDPSKIYEETFAGYRAPLRVKDWDTALWLLTIAPRPANVPELTSAIKAPALFITGDDDRVVPPEDTRRAAALIKGAEIVTVAQCGHLPHEEQPAAFLDAVNAFLDGAL